jgi:tetratricopeptide (TPR) repeat protein
MQLFRFVLVLAVAGIAASSLAQPPSGNRTASGSGSDAHSSEQADPAESGPTPPAADIRELKDRLDQLEKQLLQLRRGSVAIPEAVAEQKVLAVLETPGIIRIFTGDAEPLRLFVGRLVIVNLTREPVTIAREQIELTADGQPIEQRTPAPSWANYQFEYNGSTQPISQCVTKPSVRVASGRAETTWVLFGALPEGRDIPQLRLRINIPGSPVDLSVNDSQADALGLRVERIGPRGSVAIVTVHGVLNTINIGTLLDETSRLAGQRVVRCIIHFADGASLSDSNLPAWLSSAALFVGREAADDSGVPSFSAALRELHLASLPVQGGSPAGREDASDRHRSDDDEEDNDERENADDEASVGQHSRDNDRIHSRLSQAITAALSGVYSAAPLEEAVSALKTGTPAMQSAALKGAASRLQSAHLPLVLKLTESPDAETQQMAIAALSHFGEPPAIERLTLLVRKNVEPTSTQALVSLARSRFTSAHEAVLKLFEAERGEGRRRMGAVLARYPRPAWSAALFSVAVDPHSQVEPELIRALSIVGHPQLVSALRVSLRRPNPRLQEQAFELVSVRDDAESRELAAEYAARQVESGNITPAVLNYLQLTKPAGIAARLLASFDRCENKSQLLQTLALVGDAATAAELQRLLRSMPFPNRAEALRTMRRLDMNLFLSAADSALKAADDSLLSEAVQGLLEDASPRAIRILLDAFETSSNRTVWMTVGPALGTLGTPEARAALYRAREEGGVDRREVAINAIVILQQRSPGFRHLIEAQQAMVQERWQDAVLQLSAAIDADRQLADAWAERGSVRLRLEQFDEAGKDFAKAREIDRWSPQALTGECIVLAISGRIDDAVRRLEEGRPIHGARPLFTYNAACVYGRCVEFLQSHPNEPERDDRLARYTTAALADVKRAIEQGYRDVPWMRKDPDLRPLHSLPEFEALMQQAVGGG